MKKLVESLHVSRQIVVGVLAIALVLIGAAQGMFEGLELTVYDSWFGIRNQTAALAGRPIEADKRIVIIGVDEGSIKQIGRWPWDREVHAKLLEKLGDAKVVAFDFLWQDASRLEGDDAKLAAAIQKHGRVVLSSLVRTELVKGQPNQFMEYPTKALLDAVKATGKHRFHGQGTVNTPTDSDAAVRTYIPVDADTVGQPYPSLALAAIMHYKGISPDQVKAGSSGVMTAGDMSVERNRFGRIMLNYYGPPNTITTYPYTDVLSGKVQQQNPDAFKDKIVFVGATAETLKDTFPAPFAKDTTIGQLMPGVEIQATAAATLLNGNPIKRAPELYNILITLIFGMVVLGLSARLKAIWGAVAMVAIIAGYSVSVYYLWLSNRYWLDLVTPASATLLTFTVATVENYLREAAERRRVRNLFGRYVSHNVVKELLDHPEMLEMGGRRFEVTILFSDIRGFTSFSETRDPQEVVQRINDYCKEMVELIYKHGGTLDKYMGDGIMAYFGAPLPMEDHAERAVKCAHEMREKMKELHEYWKSQGMLTFKIGVGMNSGEVIAGNIGHPDRVEYSLIGSAVNLASRLESMTKEYAKSEYGGIVFSANTFRLAPKAVEEYQPTDLGEVEVRGMLQKVHIFSM